MVTTCVVCGYRKKKEDGVSMHRYPLEGIRRTTWLIACRLSGVSNGDRICGKHFVSNDFISGTSTINLNVVPSIFPWSNSRKRPAPKERYLYTSSSSSSDDSIISINLSPCDEKKNQSIPVLLKMN